MKRYAVRISGWMTSKSGVHDVDVEAPNMDCAFWVALYTVDPTYKYNHTELSVRLLKD